MRAKSILFTLVVIVFSSCAPKVLCPAYTAEHHHPVRMGEKI